MIPGLSSVGAFLNMSNASSHRSGPISSRRHGPSACNLNLSMCGKRPYLSLAFDAASQQHIGAFIIGIDALTQADQDLIIQLAVKHRLPGIYPSREFVDAGGLITYGVNYPDLYRRAATFVVNVFKGAKPAELPVEEPTKLEMIVNHKAAKALGLAIRPAILLRADDVIE